MASIDLGKLVHAAVHQMNENSVVTGVQKIFNRGQEMAGKAKDWASENPGVQKIVNRGQEMAGKSKDWASENPGVQKIVNRGQEMAGKAKDWASENPGIAGGAAAAAGLLGAGLAARKYMGRKKA